MRIVTGTEGTWSRGSPPIQKKLWDYDLKWAPPDEDSSSLPVISIQVNQMLAKTKSEVGWVLVFALLRLLLTFTVIEVNRTVGE